MSSPISFKTSASYRLCVALEFLSVQRTHTIAVRCRRVAPSTASQAAAQLDGAVSAIPSKAAATVADRRVRFGPKTDIALSATSVAGIFLDEALSAILERKERP
jgi:hypothetical protein